MQANRTAWVSCLVLAVTSLSSFSARNLLAEEITTPFIDKVKKGLNEQNSSESNYTEEIRSHLPAQGSAEGYSETIRTELKSTDSDKNYSEKIRSRLEPQDTSSAIDAVHSGKSELKLKRPGKFNGSVGFRFAYYTDMSVTSVPGASQRSFDGLYGSNWGPDGQIFLEHQFFHDESSVSVGAEATAGFAYRKANGTFDFPPNRPGGGTFSSSTHTNFEFTTVPVSLGGSFRVNVFNFIRPYLLGGPALIYYTEGRNDGVAGHQGFSFGILGSAGVNILLDWFSRDTAWSLYETFGTKHYYLSLDYSKLTTFSGDIRFDNSALYAGITFEF